MPYPSSIDTFAGTATQGSNQQADATLDHALQHRVAGSALLAIESTVLGTTNGTSILKSFNAGDFPARINSGGTLQQALTGTLNNSTLGTPTLVLGSDAQGDVFYRSAGGTVNRLPAGGSGQFLQTQGTSANPQWATPTINSTSFTTVGTGSGTVSINSMSDLGCAGTVVTTSKCNIMVTAEIQAFANAGTAVEYFGQIVDGGAAVVGMIPQISLVTGNRRQIMKLTGVQTNKASGTYSYKLQHRNGDNSTACTAEQAQITVFAVPTT